MDLPPLKSYKTGALLTMRDKRVDLSEFLIDTTKIRICGKGQVDFRKERLDIKMAPTPKKPHYFSLVPPIEVKGNFSDFGVGIQSGGLIGTTLKRSQADQTGVQ